jgi:tetratricopeptide (TPR) repeat protein
LALYEETNEKFPQDVVGFCGKAEVLRELGRLDEALALYEETNEKFPHNVFGYNGRAGVLILKGRIDEAIELLSQGTLSTRQEWISYHIIAMAYLKKENLDEAISRLRFGASQPPWPKQKEYFMSALGVAYLRKKQFSDAVQVLDTDSQFLEMPQRHSRHLFRSHSFAELGDITRAAEEIVAVRSTDIPRIIHLREALDLRYDLTTNRDEELALAQVEALDREIENEEFYLALAM